MQKISVILAGVLLLFALGFAEDLTESEYYHYCYRLCCLNQDAAYVEGPPQQCIGAGPDFEGNLERCHAQCIYEMNFTGGVIGPGDFVEYVDRGEIYAPPNETNETEIADEPLEPEEAEVAPPEEEEVAVAPPEPEYTNYGGPAEPEEGPEAEGEGGLCLPALALVFGLFAAKK